MPACGRNARPHVRRDIRKATLYGNLQEKAAEKGRGPDRAQNADEHFVRACAVETHVKRNLQVECRRPE